MFNSSVLKKIKQSTEERVNNCECEELMKLFKSFLDLDITIHCQKLTVILALIV